MPQNAPEQLVIRRKNVNILDPTSQHPLFWSADDIRPFGPRIVDTQPELNHCQHCKSCAKWDNGNKLEIIGGEFDNPLQTRNFLDWKISDHFLDGLERFSSFLHLSNLNAENDTAGTLELKIGKQPFKLSPELVVRRKDGVPVLAFNTGYEIREQQEERGEVSMWLTGTEGTEIEPFDVAVLLAIVQEQLRMEINTSAHLLVPTRKQDGFWLYSAKFQIDAPDAIQGLDVLRGSTITRCQIGFDSFIGASITAFGLHSQIAEHKREESRSPSE
ncbi:MAG: hypothetical protein M1840_003234 [Geoglossum simile]|nr:MAG: hypothetical protein M1840_003234 [Geoglossum simile]